MKKQIHLRAEDLNNSDKLGLTYNLGHTHVRSKTAKFSYIWVVI